MWSVLYSLSLLSFGDGTNRSSRLVKILLIKYGEGGRNEHMLGWYERVVVCGAGKCANQVITHQKSKSRFPPPTVCSCRLLTARTRRLGDRRNAALPLGSWQVRPCPAGRLGLKVEWWLTSGPKAAEDFSDGFLLWSWRMSLIFETSTIREARVRTVQLSSPSNLWLVSETHTENQKSWRNLFPTRERRMWKRGLIKIFGEKTDCVYTELLIAIYTYQELENC